MSYKSIIDYKTFDAFNALLKHLDKHVYPAGEAGGARGIPFPQAVYIKLFDSEAEDTAVLQDKLSGAAKNLAHSLNKLSGDLEFYTPMVGSNLGSATNTIQANSVCMSHTMTYHAANKHERTEGFTTHGLHVRCRGTEVIHKTLDERLESTRERYTKMEQRNELDTGRQMPVGFEGG